MKLREHASQNPSTCLFRSLSVGSLSMGLLLSRLLAAALMVKVGVRREKNGEEQYYNSSIQSKAATCRIPIRAVVSI